jgi:hypothetical protein
MPIQKLEEKKERKSDADIGQIAITQTRNANTCILKKTVKSFLHAPLAINAFIFIQK